MFNVGTLFFVPCISFPMTMLFLFCNVSIPVCQFKRNTLSIRTQMMCLLLHKDVEGNL